MDNKEVEIEYINYRGEWSERTIVPIKIWFGATEWHKEEQWFLDAFDIGKNENRTFAIKDIKKWIV